MAASDSRSQPRGLTLVELMITVAVASVVLVSATQAVMVVMQGRRTNERRLEVAEQSAIALSLIQFDVVTAGFRFASPVFTTRVLQTVTGAEAELAPITDTANCGPADWGIAPGTDTVELRFGGEDLVPGMASPMSCDPSGACALTLGGGGARNPFLAPGPDGDGALVLASNERASCLGRATAPVVSNSLSLQLVDLKLTDAPLSAFPGCFDGTFTVMRAVRRVRYLVCAPPASQPDAVPGLFRQESLDGAPFGTPALVQEGIEDLQVALRLDNSAGVLSGPGCVDLSCVCFRGAACDDVALDQAIVDSAPTATPSERALFFSRGIDLGVTAIALRGQVGRGQQEGLEQLTRPALFDHPAGTQRSDRLRKSRELSVTLPNLAQVSP